MLKEYKFLKKMGGVVVTYIRNLDDDFEFAECSEDKDGFKDYLCVINNASRYRETLNGIDLNLKVIGLPLDTAIFTLHGVSFMGTKPSIISIDKLNLRLKDIREKVTWMEENDSSDIAYKLVWVGGRDKVTISYIDLSTSEVISIVENQSLDVLGKTVYWNNFESYIAIVK